MIEAEKLIEQVNLRNEHQRKIDAQEAKNREQEEQILEKERMHAEEERLHKERLRNAWLEEQELIKQQEYLKAKFELSQEKQMKQQIEEMCTVNKPEEHATQCATGALKDLVIKTTNVPVDSINEIVKGMNKFELSGLLASFKNELKQRVKTDFKPSPYSMSMSDKFTFNRQNKLTEKTVKRDDIDFGVQKLLLQYNNPFKRKEIASAVKELSLWRHRLVCDPSEKRCMHM